MITLMTRKVTSSPRSFLRSTTLTLAMLFTALLLSTSSFAAGLLNINDADAPTLAASLSGIGPSKAQAIVDYRTENGAFESIEDLQNVPGIGQSTLDRIRALLTVSDAGQAGNVPDSGTTR